MKSPPLLKSVMTPFPHAIGVDAGVVQAEDMMREHDIHHLPVIDGHALVGVVSQRDLLAARAGAGGMADGLFVSDFSQSEAYTVHLETPLAEVLAAMAERHIGSVLVTFHGRLAGVFTATDACRAFGDYLNEQFPPAPDGDSAA